MPDKRRAPYISTGGSTTDLTTLNSLNPTSGSTAPNGYSSPLDQTKSDAPKWMAANGDKAKYGLAPNGMSTYSSSLGSNGDASHFTGRRTSVVHPQPLPFDSRTGSYLLPGGHTRRTSSLTPTPPFQSTMQRLLSSPLPSKSTLKFIFLCTLWYGTSALSSNTGKVILNNFKFPVTLTIVQFFFVAGYCWLATEGRQLFPVFRLIGGLMRKFSGSRALTQKQAGGMRLRRPSRAILTNTWPMAVFQVGGHIFSSMAISRVPVSTVHTIKALSPLFTVLAYALLFKISYSPATYLSLLPLTLGVMLACSFDMSASNILGLMCAFGSTLVFVSQNIVFKKLMPSSGSGTNHGPGSGGPNNSLSTAQTSPKLDKINLLFYSSGMAFLSMIPLWAYSDMPTLLALWLDPDSVHLAAKVNIGAPPSITFYFFLNGTVHFAQNLLAFAILSSTSPVTYSIASLVKRIAVICLAIIWFNQKVHPVQAVGICLTGLGLWMYNAAKRDVEKGEKKVRRMEAVKDGMLPLTRADQKLLDERSEMNTPSLSDTEPYPDRTYGIQDLTLQSTSQINGAYAFNDEKLNRANQYGYAQPYPPATHSLNSPPISGGTALPINGMHIHHKTESASYMNGGTARRRLSNDQNKMVAAIGKYPVDEGKRHVDDEEVLQDIDPR